MIAGRRIKTVAFVATLVGALATALWTPHEAFEAFEVAQWASQSSAATAIQRMSTRFDSSPAARLIFPRSLSYYTLAATGRNTITSQPLTAEEVQRLLGP